MKNKFSIGTLILIVIILGVLNIFLLKNNQKEEVLTPTTIVPSPTTFVEVPMLSDPISATSEGKPMVGSDKDTHGCIGSAGYTWCGEKNKCLRVWEEKCE